MAPGDPIPADLLSCDDASDLCTGGCAVSFKKKRNGLPYPATTLQPLLAAIQRVLHSNKVHLNIFDTPDMQFQSRERVLDPGQSWCARATILLVNSSSQAQAFCPSYQTLFAHREGHF